METLPPVQLPVGWALSIWFPAFVNFYLGWAFGNVAPFTPYSCLSNPNKTHLCTELDFSGGLNLISCWCPIWGK